ncbi:MAG: hypothetical protein ACI9JZ_002556 [Lentimonas sp.]|jgi:hypothetical protein
MLIDFEAVSCSLKLELNMRSAYYRKESRCDGHLFITVLAYPIRRCKSSAANSKSEKSS